MNRNSAGERVVTGEPSHTATQAASQSPAEMPTGVAQVITPSGIEVYYQSGPKRLYRIRDLGETNPFGDDLPRDVHMDIGDDDPDYPWHEVPSVSTVLGVLDKPALVWWGMKVGIQGVLELFNRAILVGGDGDLWREIANGDSPIDEDQVWGVDDIVDALKREKLTVNHQRDKAADRGTNVHSALEAFSDTGVLPDPRFFPENERGYVQGLVNFINDAHPHPLQSEVMVASLDGYAGRFDLLANLDFAGKVVTKTYPKREDLREQISGAWLLDLKTSKDVYPSYHLQLAAYLSALDECGYERPEHAGVVRVTDDGRYELVECKATYDDFLNVLCAYNSIERIKGK